ncbi:MAG TPA: OsmC family protein [Candidatus Limnocylindrales bacterium]|nr:OsmC family protein [Candidatus Limnocylindrales bacterium]
MSIQDAVARASAYLSEHPMEARYRDAGATARLTSGLQVDVTGPGGESLHTDMPRGIGGGATQPSPGWFFRAASAACVASLIAIRAAATGQRILSCEVRVDSESDDRGILGLDDDVPAGPLSARIEVMIEAPGMQRADRVALARWAVDHCPVTDAMARAVPIEVDVR